MVKIVFSVYNSRMVTQKYPFIPRYLELRYKTWYAVLYVPKDVRHILGKVKFYRSTQTHDLRVAKGICALWVMEWKSQIESARSKSDIPIINSALELRKILKSSPKHLIDDVIEEQKDKYREKYGDLDAEVFEEIARGKSKHIKEYLSGWRKHQHDKKLKEKTINQMESDLELITEHFPTLSTMTPDLVREWGHKLSSGREEHRLTPSSIGRIFGSGRSLIDYLKMIREIPKTTPTPFVVPDQLKISKKRNSKSVHRTQPYVPFKDEDVELLYGSAINRDDHQLADLIMIGAYTGARIEEICSLKCSDIDQKKQTIEIGESKTEAGNRTIPVHKKLIKKFEELIDLSEDGYLISGLTFNKYDDRSNAIGKRFGRLKTKEGFDERHVFHSIRKTFTTQLENKKIGENVTADIIGHEKPNITYGIYSGGTTVDVMRDAINKVRFKF